ncbi:dTMP kinase [Hyphococcus sp.]|uniref:dTMP kinase n=1 Tax=Hyphococcus sp. TaxID=2038636 RepID=UPI002084775F|nr:MAG: thymidylate kinase [Marinicaulis sp.]
MRKESHSPGLFISFEGGDGAGKSTQIRLLADALRATGREVVTTREPGGSPGAESIRKLLLEGAADKWSPLTEALLMYASRADHLERTIEPALKRGAIVISDRFADSTMAYQGLAGALGEAAVAALYRLVVANRGPDLTIILDLPVEEGLKRSGATGGQEQRFESKGEAYQEQVRAAFLEIARREPDRCVVINAAGKAADIAARIIEAVQQRTGSLLKD